jgi:hypothetical protein
MIDKTFDYWYATDIYPYYTTSYNGLEGIMQELEMEKEFFKHMDTLIELILKVARK